MTLSGSDDAIAYPCRDGHVARRPFDQGKLIIGQPEVYGVAARIACGGSSARSLRFHVADITVKQKTLASPELMLYDKDMNTTSATTVLANTIAQIEAKGYTRSEAYDLAIAYMISEDADTMRKLLAAAQSAFQAANAA